MSRGGTEVYYPDDVKTRFADVWGQDQVLEKVKENLVLLEDPGSIESRGGHVPSGILLYGPPGTGKTLMAEAVAGETGKPYVFVEPGAFMNMFMGVGVLKVRSLFKKLRKLAMRFGGVIVFFDEADALGNRGGVTGGAPAASPTQPDACNGFSYLSEPTRLSMRESAPPGDAGDRGSRAGHRAPRRHGRAHGRGRRRPDGAAGAARRAVRLEEAARLLQPLRPAPARHATEAATEVPHPHDDGDEPGRLARRRAACAPAASTASTRSATRRRKAGSAPSRGTSAGSRTS